MVKVTLVFRFRTTLMTSELLMFYRPFSASLRKVVRALVNSVVLGPCMTTVVSGLVNS